MMPESKSLKTKNGQFIDGLKLIKPKVFEDERGFFYESWNAKDYEIIFKDSKLKFVQDNHSRSSYGVLRGLHYQLPPAQQGKLIRCTHGLIYDVAVDLRKSSESFGMWFGIELSSINKFQLWVPNGFAHGFLTLSKFAEVQYKTTDYWCPDLERSIKWDDESLKIDWPLTSINKEDLTINSKDSNGLSFDQANSIGEIFS